MNMKGNHVQIWNASGGSLDAGPRTLTEKLRMLDARVYAREMGGASEEALDANKEAGDASKEAKDMSKEAKDECKKA